MTSINPINVNYLMDAMHQDRLRELEQQHLARQARKPGRNALAPILAGLGRGLVTLGSRLQARSAPERRQTPTSA